MRASLSALGIAIGVAAIVAVLGLSASSQAGLLNEISQLGTNLLTVSNGQSFTGGVAELPTAAPGMIGRIDGVQQVQTTGMVVGANAYRNPYIPAGNTNGLTVQAASLDLLPVIATTFGEGAYLNAATAQEPVAVVGSGAAQRLGIDRIYPGERIWVGAPRQLVKIEVTGLTDEVDAWCISEVEGVRKPDPAIFRLAAEKCGMPLEGAWMIGDSPEADIGGAVAAGISTAWIHRGREWPLMGSRRTWWRTMYLMRLSRSLPWELIKSA